MQSAQKGSILLYLLIIASLISLVVWFLNKPGAENRSYTSPISQQKEPAYEESEYKFKFEYPSNFEVVSETEEEYSKRTQTNYRKNFTGYVGYTPPVFLKGIIVKDKSYKLTSDQFDKSALILWVFENPKNLDEKAWFDSFWYYPFVWGIFAYNQKMQIAPKDEATVSGVLTHQAIIDYSPGKPKFVLVPRENKMFLFRVIDGEKILESFKFQ